MQELYLRLLLLSIIWTKIVNTLATELLSAQRRPKVIYQNEFLLAIDKPAGLSFHSEFEPGTVQLTRDILDEEEDWVQDLYPVHRLDKTTSGILIFAKDSFIATQL